MALLTKKNRLNRFSLKCLAVVFGYGIWHTISSHHKITVTRDLPLCFYNCPVDCTITAPETVRVTLHATRADLLKTSMTAAVHCNAQQITEKTQSLTLRNEQIFLPESVRLVHYHPKEIALAVHKNQVSAV